MKISRDEVMKIAHLARLEIDEDGIGSMTDQMGRILEYIDKLKDADVEGVGLSSGTALMNNVLRDDIPSGSPGPEVTLANAPERDQDFYTVPRVVK